MTHAVKRASAQAHQPLASVMMTVTLVETAAVTLMTLALQVSDKKYSMGTAPFVIAGSPRLPRDITVTDNTGTSVTITWLIPYIASTPETYSIQYGTSADNLNLAIFATSGSDTSIIDQVYSRTISALSYVTTYYFRMSVTNDIGTVTTETLSFTTAEGGEYSKARHT